MHESGEDTPQLAGRERKSQPSKVGECVPGDVVQLANGDVVQVTARVWDAPMGRKKVETEFGWSELHVLDAETRVKTMVQWAR